MAGGAKTLTTNVVINATSKGFAAVGNTLTELGIMVDGLSQQIINFGKDSASLYRDFEYNMNQTKIALATSEEYRNNYQLLESDMEKLSATAKEWADNTIFHASDVSNAITDAARAGWDYDQIMSGIPAAMRLAEAGGLDLSTAIDQIVKVSNALGISFEDQADFADMWTFAANSSATSVEELGEAMLKMGGTMRFADSSEELLTLLAVTANAGTVGSQAGTLLRSAMIRLVNPTKKAKEAMASLGATNEEILEIEGMDADQKQALADANERLAKTGFSLYDENGHMKSFLETFTDLYVALGEINGGFENLTDNEDVEAILGAIFPTRTVAEAINLLNGAAEGYGGLFEQLKNGEAEGYGEWASSIMMDSLYGDEEIFLSKLENLHLAIGETLSEDLRGFYDIIGEIFDAIAGLDQPAMDALVAGLEGLAAAGPGLLALGGGARIIGILLNNPWLSAAAGITAVGIALYALGEYMESFDREEYEAKFGEIQLDPTTIENYLDELNAAYKNAYNDVDVYNQQFQQSFEQYISDSGTIKKKLVEAMLTNHELTQEEQDDLILLGNSMVKSVASGIEDNYSALVSSLTTTFGGDDATENPLWSQIMQVIIYGHDQDVAQAESLGQELRDALTEAFTDGITADEISRIQNIFNQLNELMAHEADAVRAADYARELERAQTLGIDSVEDAAETVKNKRADALGDLAAQEAYEISNLEYFYDNAIAEGMMYDADNNPLDKNAALSAVREKYRGMRASAIADNAMFLRDLYGIAGGESELADGITLMYQAIDEFSKYGYSDQFGQKYASIFQDKNLVKFAAGMIDAYGGINEITQGMAMFGEFGQTEAHDLYGGLKSMYEMFSAAYDARYWGLSDAQEAIFAGNPSFLPQAQSFTYTGVPEPTAVDAGIDPMIASAMAADEIPVTVAVDVETEAAKGKMDSELNNQTFTEMIDAVLDDAYSKVNAFQAYVESIRPTIVVQSTTTGGGGGASIDDGGGGGGHGFAEGGRATTASIFGEAGPEWAIPEEHSQRTADLLNAARAASGFSWPELITRIGGLNANANNTPSTLVYSPTIHAGDARGVEQALMADKSRFERWWEERKQRDAMEVYA